MKILVYDFGLCTEHAIRLARDGNEVFYFVPWENAFPKSNLSIIGEGLEGLTRVINFWDFVDKVDLICFFDTYCADLEEYLRKKGYKVWGTGRAEVLENNRWKMKQLQKYLDLPLQHIKLIQGFGSLIEHLKEKRDAFVKLNVFRGDIDTFEHKEYSSTQAQFLGELLLKTGAKAKKLEFIIEDKIGEIEPGYDGFVIDGKYPSEAMYGYEQKGVGYIGKIIPYNQLPNALKLVNDKLIPIWQKLSPVRTFFSTEVRVTKDGKGYLIDPCVRAPMPVPSAIELEIFKNISSFITEGAEGKMTSLKPIAKYGAGVCFESDWAEDHWTEIPINPKIRKWIKLRMACKIDNKYYALPGFKSLGSVIGLGKTIDEAIKNVKKNVELSGIDKIREVTYTISGLEEIRDKTIKESQKYGIPF